jgi:hypothetical protein
VVQNNPRFFGHARGRDNISLRKIAQTHSPTPARSRERRYKFWQDCQNLSTARAHVGETSNRHRDESNPEMAVRLKPMRETVRDELEIPQAPKGTNQHTGARDNITPSLDRGTSASYTLRRLKRDRRWSQLADSASCFSLAIFGLGMRRHKNILNKFTASCPDKTHYHPMPAGAS